MGVTARVPAPVEVVAVVPRRVLIQLHAKPLEVAVLAPSPIWRRNPGAAHQPLIAPAPGEFMVRVLLIAHRHVPTRSQRKHQGLVSLVRIRMERYNLRAAHRQLLA